MRISWMFMCLLVCKSSHGAQDQSDSKCDWSGLTIHDSANNNVTVTCPLTQPNDEEISFYFLKDEDVIHNHTCKQKTNCTGMKWDAVELHTNGSHWFFTLKSGHNIRGLYRCNITKTYPPPLMKRCGKFLLVKECPHAPLNPTRNPTGVAPNTCQEFLWIWIMVIAIVSIYGVTVTIIALFNWLKLKNTENQSDYMNTKPRAPRDRKKKKGLQNIQRHF
ncbi:uncharacterized protein LOC100699099 [Oreochromis niloticus]|uniref:CD28 protein n=2 Tax=Oreochromis TaxID=8139 RepID=I3K2P5_ORENI|nr:uncharacterized protein LOC100699099 [Oreochromis niloticus]XP_031594332.1 uncharacterized protein LOC116319209 [Oreochromis aureus]AMQ36815.1 CD28 protein [Oreochromis niloticus]